MSNDSKLLKTIASPQERLARSNGTAAQPSKTGALGNATDLRTTPPLKLVRNFLDKETGELLEVRALTESESISRTRRIRFELHEIAKKTLYSYSETTRKNVKGYDIHHRTCSCTGFRLSTTTEILKSKTNGKYFYGGLMNCGNGHTCPICSDKLAERKANEMREGFDLAKEKGLNIQLLTFTAPHYVTDKIEVLVDKMNAALREFWRNNVATRFKKRYGIVGNIRTLEVRYGDNGWHPHFHIIVFSKKPLPVTKRTLVGRLQKNQDPEWDRILERWQGHCLNAGLKKPNLFGMDLQNGSQASEYINKYGSDDEILETKTGKKITWDMADEMTKGNKKNGRSKSITPWEILSLIEEGETKEIRKFNWLLFLQYARAMHGKTMIKWSRNLRKDLGMANTKELTDAEIIQQEEDKAILQCLLLPYEWKIIQARKQRPLLLDIITNGGIDAVARYCYGFVDDDNGRYTFEQFYIDFLSRGDANNDDDLDDQINMNGKIYYKKPCTLGSEKINAEADLMLSQSRFYQPNYVNKYEQMTKNAGD